MHLSLPMSASTRCGRRSSTNSTSRAAGSTPGAWAPWASACLRPWVSELHTHGRRQAEAHGAQAPGVDPAARLVEFVELRRPHLVLTDRSEERLVEEVV